MTTVPSPLDLVHLPFMRTATSRCPAARGRRRAARRLDRPAPAGVLRARGRAAPPSRASWSADAAGIRPVAAAMAVALAYAGGVYRAGLAAGGRAADAATGLLLVAALAHRRDPRERRVPVRRARRQPPVRHAARPRRRRPARGRCRRRARRRRHGHARPGVARIGLRPRRRPRDRHAGRRRRRAAAGLVAAAVVTALPAVGALLTTALFIVPAATVRLVARTVPALLVGSVALAAAEGLDRRVRGAVGRRRPRARHRGAGRAACTRRRRGRARRGPRAAPGRSTA